MLIAIPPAYQCQSLKMPAIQGLRPFLTGASFTTSMNRNPLGTAARIYPKSEGVSIAVRIRERVCGEARNEPPRHAPRVLEADGCDRGERGPNFIGPRDNPRLLAFHNGAEVRHNSKDAVSRVVNMGDLSDSARCLGGRNTGISLRNEPHNGLCAGLA